MSALVDYGLGVRDFVAFLELFDPHYALVQLHG